MVIVGKPNVGKSSLFNRLLKIDRAIVTEIPGTTRDLLIESANIEGIPINFIDTAGIRSSLDIIELEGIKRSHDAIEEADLIIALIDGSCELDSSDSEIIERIKGKNVLMCLNKIDLKQKVNSKEVEKLAEGHHIVKISAKTGQGEEELKRRIFTLMLSSESIEKEEEIITNIRHNVILSQTRELLNKAYECLLQGLSEEFILVDLHRAYEKLGEITGRTTIEDILSHIFSSFCIGK